MNEFLRQGNFNPLDTTTMSNWGSSAVPAVMPTPSPYQFSGGLGTMSSTVPSAAQFSAMPTALSMQGMPGTSTTAPATNWFDNLPDWMKGAVGSKEQPGWGGMALGAASGLMNAYMGLQQLGLAKESLAFSKDSFNKQYTNQTKLTNANLEDRQAARVASNSGAYQSVGDYMNKNRVG